MDKGGFKANCLLHWEPGWAEGAEITFLKCGPGPQTQGADLDALER